MKTKSVTLLLLIHFYLGYGQINVEGTGYSLGTHGIDLTLNKQWNPSQRSKDYFEVLYGCSGSQNCANIQIVFRQKEDWSGFDQIISYVIREQKRKYPDLVYAKSQVKIDGIDSEIVDFLIKADGRFVGQTLALLETNNEIAILTFTGELQKNNKQAPTNYARERILFMEILKSIKISEPPLDPISSPDLLLISCNDTTSFLMAEKDIFKCFIQLNGKSYQKTGQNVVVDNTVLRSFLGYKKPFLSEEDTSDSDQKALFKFIYVLSAQIYFAANPGKPNHYYYSHPLELPEEKQAIFWYAIDYSPKKLKQLERGEIDYIDPVLGNVFVSLIVDDYIYSIQVFQSQDQSIEQIKVLLTELIVTLQYTKETINQFNPCSRMELL